MTKPLAMTEAPLAPPQLEADAQRIEKTLQEIFARLDKTSAPPRLLEAMAYATLGGGKRLRGALVLGAARLAGEEGSAIHVASAIECLHAYSLIHDDLPAMDNADTRRGKASCHVAFDESTAILAGDALQSLAFEILANSETHPDAKIRNLIIGEIASAIGILGMAGGQMLDLEAESRAFDIDETKAMQLMKTGALIKASVRAGIIAGGGNEQLLKAADSYAERIGLAFQITDDMLDRGNSSGAIGKPIKQDKAAGKASFVELYGMEKASAEAARLVDEAGEILRKADTGTPENLNYMLEIANFVIKRNY